MWEMLHQIDSSRTEFLLLCDTQWKRLTRRWNLEQLNRLQVPGFLLLYWSKENVDACFCVTFCKTYLTQYLYVITWLRLPNYSWVWQLQNSQLQHHKINTHYSRNLNNHGVANHKSIYSFCSKHTFSFIANSNVHLRFDISLLKDGSIIDYRWWFLCTFTKLNCDTVLLYVAHSAIQRIPNRAPLLD